MPSAIVAVHANPSERAREDQFNDWYAGGHIAPLLALDGFVGATRSAPERSRCTTRWRPVPSSCGSR